MARGLGLAHADHRVGRGPAQQAPAHIRRTKAVLQVHGRTQSIHLCVDESPRQHALQQLLIIAAARHRAPWACGGRWWEQAPAPAAWLRPCAASSGAGIARAPAPQQPCAPGCALRSTTAAGSGHATRSRRNEQCACRTTTRPSSSSAAAGWSARYFSMDRASSPADAAASSRATRGSYQPLRARRSVMCAM